MSESELSSPVVSSVENPEPLCSICLEEISATCGRTVVTLQCSHIFHLDYIGSAFNVAGIMQCPNCRQIENGEWLCFENRDSETDMEQNFNQDVEDQEPEMGNGLAKSRPLAIVLGGHFLPFVSRSSLPFSKVSHWSALENVQSGWHAFFFRSGWVDQEVEYEGMEPLESCLLFTLGCSGAIAKWSWKCRFHCDNEQVRSVFEYCGVPSKFESLFTAEQLQPGSQHAALPTATPRCLLSDACSCHYSSSETLCSAPSTSSTSR
ncbi:hypothetical protein LWI29_015400 [Acer saccharum]|uniref:RING-type domain-containing protein n=1 Tax=Acer saccharum TaxID=4024 RepID=A0AA39TRR4_ACESA|nr:hypothetical protein LWI29_015400 [Acer saccharum]